MGTPAESRSCSHAHEGLYADQACQARFFHNRHA